jgi:hypothetical protein
MTQGNEMAVCGIVYPDDTTANLPLTEGIQLVAPLVRRSLLENIDERWPRLRHLLMDGPADLAIEATSAGAARFALLYGMTHIAGAPWLNGVVIGDLTANDLPDLSAFMLATLDYVLEDAFCCGVLLEIEPEVLSLPDFEPLGSRGHLWIARRAVIN